jgi:hypothetical protein
VICRCGKRAVDPRRPTGTKRVTCPPATYSAVHDFVTNPVYAVTFAFGRTTPTKASTLTAEIDETKSRV